MRKTSQRRVARSSRSKPIPRATLYSKVSKKYVPLEDEVFVNGERCPSFSLEEANERGLITVQQLADKLGVSKRSCGQWLQYRGIEPVARVAQPKYGHQFATAPYLYDFGEIVEEYKRKPYQHRTSKKES